MSKNNCETDSTGGIIILIIISTFAYLLLSHSKYNNPDLKNSRPDYADCVITASCGR